ncbi:helix-turn-helix transcriptional regulator [Actinomadura graeca]|uniref:Helix-turn-helix transcriptional regulator n=1 Tax=Actinomadura graeca TaxID=2750812 RepID=A0ABX8QY08_9ACTN|nr:helix-turn-helix transcriptional regulator [Actinomadura graeca]QXJ23721.1 helix-turn-helix transcriptional regulator [Actinomadura graeca]
MSDDTPSTVGTRLARARKRRGLTQIGLAERATYSRSHIAGVEAGRKVATPAFVASVAAALNVDPAELYGQPYQAHGRDDRLHAVIPELRRAIALGDVGPDLRGSSRSLDVLAAETATVRRLLNDAKLSKAGTRLPSVLEELSWWAHDGDDPRAWGLLSRALYLAASLTRRLGYSGDCLALLEREAAAARRSGEPNLRLLEPLLRALVLTGMNQSLPALRLLDRASAEVVTGRPDAGEVQGALGLRSAVIAARAGDATRAWDYHGRVTDMIHAAGQVTAVYGQEVTAANAAVHGAAVAVELGDMDEAVRRDERIGERTLSALPLERRTHHEIDMARALTEAGAYDRALRRLSFAERNAPLMTHYHPTAHTVVAHLVDVRRTLPEPLRRLHARVVG